MGELQGGRHVADPTAKGAGAWNDGPSASGAAAVQLAFRVPPPAVDACHAELVAKGVTIVREPTDLPGWRHRTLFFRDPEDNVIEIYAEY
ncbi:VOC family protein [Streptosporangium lutulentum]